MSDSDDVSLPSDSDSDEEKKSRKYPTPPKGPSAKLKFDTSDDDESNHYISKEEDRHVKSKTPQDNCFGEKRVNGDSSYKAADANRRRRSRSSSVNSSPKLWKKRSQSRSASSSSRQSTPDKRKLPPRKLSPKHHRISPPAAFRGKRSTPPNRRRISPPPRRRISPSRLRQRNYSRSPRGRSPPVIRERKHSESLSPWRKRPRSRSRSGSANGRKHSPSRLRHKRSRRDSEDEELVKEREDNKFRTRRDERMNILERGVRRVWGQSPTQQEIEDVYALYQEFEEVTQKQQEDKEKLKKKREKEKKAEDKKRLAELTKGGAEEILTSTSSEDSDKEKERRKKKKHKKNKKHKKEKKVRKAKKEKREKKSKKTTKEEEEIEEWVEVTDATRQKRAAQAARDADEMQGPAIPDHLLEEGYIDTTQIPFDYGKEMTKQEAEAFAAYLARGERIPRRGEIGLSSNEITDYERAGYVMSGTRHKAMEATRIRKENMVMTAEEKRMLSGFSIEDRKKKEENILNQFRQLINVKRAD